jgi:hypothetical protein
MRNVVHHRHLSTIAGIVLAALGGTGAAQAADSHFFGRWTVSDEKPAYSAKGALYKTLDVAPCGADFCGVSVNDKGQCGETLFRFFMKRINEVELVGHGHWGEAKKKLMIDYSKTETGPANLYLGLGADDMDLSGREGSIPTFDANYNRVGDAQCRTN